MPRYRTEFGVLVNIPQEKAARIGGLTPVDSVASAPPVPPKPPTRKTGRRVAAASDES